MNLKNLTFLSLFIVAISCKSKDEINQTVEISCGQCQFNLEGDGCSLAVKIDDKAYFVEGFGIDDFGDAHDENSGFCNVIRKGEITGTIENGKFLASSIKLQD
ncbi:DUF6370 family protein [Polaribacter porphyrae]|uniref:Uncharacterized protein n=1 Tax=Polaribacter porphyrae TaxID=1137780 RepID=A0A2S7WSR4_9FLAO|nr:DUF6370 family protein [Polaribacter porphyrae]PQJ80351.1 hypothetical protein BTO18_14725 [Polaribacter porphyrae]